VLSPLFYLSLGLFPRISLFCKFIGFGHFHHGDMRLTSYPFICSFFRHSFFYIELSLPLCITRRFPFPSITYPPPFRTPLDSPSQIRRFLSLYIFAALIFSNQTQTAVVPFLAIRNTCLLSFFWTFIPSGAFSSVFCDMFEVLGSLSNRTLRPPHYFF